MNKLSILSYAALTPSLQAEHQAKLMACNFHE